MTVLLFLASFIGALVSLVVCILRLFVCVGANGYKHDSGTKYRNKKYRKVLWNFVFAIVLFVLAAHFASVGLGF